MSPAQAQNPNDCDVSESEAMSLCPVRWHKLRACRRRENEKRWFSWEA